MNRTDMDRAATGGRPYNSETHRRRSIRLKDYDYSHAGAYFATICTRDRACLFGDVAHGEMRLNDAGRMVADTWVWLGRQYPYVELDDWIVMPNHLHGIIVISADDGGRGGSRTAPTDKRKPLGRLIGAFKTVSTKRFNEMCGTPSVPVWQRNYYEHIVRNEESLNRIRQYIAENPLQWAMDRENPVGVQFIAPAFPDANEGAINRAPTRDEPWRI